MNLRIKILREQRGLKQSDVAEAIGVAKSNISKYELGQIEPNLEQLVALANFFNVSVDYLLGITDTPFITKGAVAVPEEIRANNLDYIYIMGANGIRMRHYVPPEKMDRFRKLIEGGFPELLED